MQNLVVGILVLSALVGWLVVAGRREKSRQVGAAAADPWWRRHRWPLVGAVFVVVGVNAALMFRTPEDDELFMWSVGETLFGLMLAAVVLGALGWAVTWAARRRLRSLDGPGAEAVVLAGRRLTLARTTWLILFGALAVVFVANLGGLWAEASRVRIGAVPHDEFLGEGFFSLSLVEARHIGGTSIPEGLEVPTWYPTLVVVRHAVVYAAALAIAWFIFSRRPRHWMAFFVSIFIGLMALGPGGGAVRATGEGYLATLGSILQVLALVSLGAFLWAFPDGRFRGTYARWLLVAAGIVFVGALFLGEAVWFVIILAFFALVAGGIAVQVFRYRHASAGNRRQARGILVVLGLLMLWLVGGGDTLYTVFDGATWPEFLWRQAHLTLFLATPVILGLWILWLVRSQGWWDLDLFVNRGAVFAVVAPVLGALYLGVVLGIGAVFSRTGQNGTALAVVAATIATAFAYRPTHRAVQHAIDRRFFPDRQRSASVVRAFGEGLRSDVGREAARERLIASVSEALQPTTVTLRLRPFTEPGEDR